VEAAVKNVEDALKSDDTAKIVAATQALEAVYPKIAAAAQAGASAAAGESKGAKEPKGGTDEPKKAKGSVVDADFEVVDDNKS